MLIIAASKGFRMRKYLEQELDAIDIKIIRELVNDGRIPIAHLASKIGIDRRSAQRRLDRIKSQGIIRIIAHSGQWFMGASVAVSLGFNVMPGHDVHAVAEKLSAYPGFGQIAIAAGPYHIVTWSLFNKRESLSAFLRNEIGKIPGLASVETLIHLETVKNVMTYPIVETTSEEHDTLFFKEEESRKYDPDQLDLAIYKELRKDGRIKVAQLSENLGISRVSASKRLNHLLSEGVIAIFPIIDPGSLGYEVAARIGFNILPGKIDDVAQKLSSFNMVHFLAVTVGRYDILVGVHFPGLHELSDFIREILDKIPEITNHENMIYLDIVKNPFEFITDVNSD